MGFPSLKTLILFFIILLVVIFINISPVDSVHSPYTREDPFKLRVNAEFVNFCKDQKEIAKNPDKAHSCKEEDFDKTVLNAIFSIFLIILYGTFIRIFLKSYELSFPYTVIMLITGGCTGMITRFFCNKSLNMFTLFSHLSPKLYLYTFLPILIFDSAFSMHVHTFKKSLGQIIVLALPGMLLSTSLTAIFVHYYFPKYEWNAIRAGLFGAIISATDPVAVVVILKDLGTSDVLKVLVEGESLLNDGIAILLFEIFEHILEDEVNPVSKDDFPLWVHVFFKFLKITIGGSIFGYLMAKFSIFWLYNIFNQKIEEVLITLVAAYLTYYVAEDMLEVSGVIALVVLGLKMSSEKTCLTPEVEESVHKFWSIMEFLANTLLFFIMGVIITQTAFASGLETYDYLYLIVLYLIIHVIRFVMLLVCYPFLKCMGYGMPWETIIILLWGGLRGAIGLCLALEIAKNPHLCRFANMGPKYLFLVGGIVLFTLVINGTTTKKLLSILKITRPTKGSLLESEFALASIYKAREKFTRQLRQMSYFNEADFATIKKLTYIDDPYKKYKEKPLYNPDKIPSIISITPIVQVHEPNQKEYEELTEIARLRIIKAMKMSFWRQFNVGLLTPYSLQTLIKVAEDCEDKMFYVIHCTDLKKYWKVGWFFPCLRRCIPKCLGNTEKTEMPKKKFRRFFWQISHSLLFDHIINFLVIVNSVFVIWEFAEFEFKGHLFFSLQFFVIINLIFTTIFTLELIIKILGLGLKEYMKIGWSYIDILVLAISYADLILILATDNSKTGKYLKFVKFLKLIRILKVIKPLHLRVMVTIERKINRQIFNFYDIGKGFETASDEALRLLPDITENKKVIRKLQAVIQKEKEHIIRDMAIIQKEHPTIAIAVKTRHACKEVLDNIKYDILLLKKTGKLYWKESRLLLLDIRNKVKDLWNFLPSVPPMEDHVMISSIPWVIGRQDILTFFLANSTVMHFEEDDVILSEGDPPNGIFIILSGTVRVEFKPKKIYKRKLLKGILPNSEIMNDLSYDNPQQDFFSTGSVLGELGVLNKQKRASEAICIDDVKVAHITEEKMEEALAQFKDGKSKGVENEKHDSLTARMWRNIGIKLGVSILEDDNMFKKRSLARIRTHLEGSAVLIGKQYETMNVPGFISEVLLLHGKVRDGVTKKIYTAPSLIPRSCTKLAKANTNVITRIMVVENDEEEYEDLTIPDYTPSQIDIKNALQVAGKMKRKQDPESSGALRRRRKAMAVERKQKKRRKRRSKRKSKSEGKKKNPSFTAKKNRIAPSVSQKGQSSQNKIKKPGK